MRILLVEDEAMVAMSLVVNLTAAGHQLIGPAAKAGDGLRLAEASRPDLALVNINLRDGGGAGIDLAREMRGRWGTPVLFTSGQVAEARRNKDAAIGYLAKPYSPEAVLASVEIAKAIGDGHVPPRDQVPDELELFGEVA